MKHSLLARKYQLFLFLPCAPSQSPRWGGRGGRAGRQEAYGQNALLIGMIARLLTPGLYFFRIQFRKQIRCQVSSLSSLNHMQSMCIHTPPPHSPMLLCLRRVNHTHGIMNHFGKDFQYPRKYSLCLALSYFL